MAFVPIAVWEQEGQYLGWAESGTPFGWCETTHYDVPGGVVLIVCSFCPPDGIVLDPFSGSGATCHAAILHNRRFIGCDVRESQVELCARRMRSVTPNLVGA